MYICHKVFSYSKGDAHASWVVLGLPWHHMTDYIHDESKGPLRLDLHK